MMRLCVHRGFRSIRRGLKWEGPRDGNQAGKGITDDIQDQIHASVVWAVVNPGVQEPIVYIPSQLYAFSDGKGNIKWPLQEQLHYGNCTNQGSSPPFFFFQRAGLVAYHWLYPYPLCLNIMQNLKKLIFYHPVKWQLEIEIKLLS